MARLLVFLACARAGAAGIMDALDIKAVCEVPTDGGPQKIYLDIVPSKSPSTKLNMVRTSLNSKKNLDRPQLLSHAVPHGPVGRPHDALRLVQLPQLGRRPHHAPLGVCVGPRDDALGFRVRDFGPRPEL